jgi:hypothetical protein
MPGVPTPSPFRKEKAVSQRADFYRPGADADRIGHALVAEAGRRASDAGLQPSDFALTLLLHPSKATGATLPTGFSYRGDAMFYPCSVVKLFLVVAAQLELEAGKLTSHEELDRAMRELVR